MIAGLWGPVFCPFRRVTGLPCPVCGTTTALLLTVQGRLGDAVRVNPLGVIVAVAIAWVVLSRAYALAKSRPVTRPVVTLPRGRPQQLVTGAVVLGSWVVRWHAPARLVGG